MVMIYSQDPHSGDSCAGFAFDIISKECMNCSNLLLVHRSKSAKEHALLWLVGPF